MAKKVKQEKEGYGKEKRRNKIVLPKYKRFCC